MSFWRRHRFGLAHLVALVLLLAALAPGMSRALAHVQDHVLPWSQLCSATSPSEADGGAAHPVLQHCPMCHLASQAPALPLPEAAKLTLLPVERDGLPPLAQRTARPLFAWAAPPSRAPPALG